MKATTTTAATATPQPGNGSLAVLSFHVTVRTRTHRTRYDAHAASAGDAWSDAAAMFFDAPCGITVTPSGA